MNFTVCHSLFFVCTCHSPIMFGYTVTRGVPIHIISVANIEISIILVGADIAAKNRYDTPIHN